MPHKKYFLIDSQPYILACKIKQLLEQINQLSCRKEIHIQWHCEDKLLKKYGCLDNSPFLIQLFIWFNALFKWQIPGITLFTLAVNNK